MALNICKRSATAAVERGFLRGSLTRAEAHAPTRERKKKNTTLVFVFLSREKKKGKKKKKLILFIFPPTLIRIDVEMGFKRFLI